MQRSRLHTPITLASCHLLVWGAALGQRGPHLGWGPPELSMAHPQPSRAETEQPRVLPSWVVTELGAAPMMLPHPHLKLFPQDLDAFGCSPTLSHWSPCQGIRQGQVSLVWFHPTGSTKLPSCSSSSATVSLWLHGQDTLLHCASFSPVLWWRCFSLSAYPGAEIYCLSVLLHTQHFTHTGVVLHCLRLLLAETLALLSHNAN